MANSINPILKSLFLPNTDSDIIDSYAGLAQRAQDRTFGMLEEEVVIVDTETTGLDLQNCELIQIAACRIHENKIIERFNEFIKPKKEIPSFIENLTGISNEMVANARSADEVIDKFSDFVHGSPIVAHNVAFDRHFLEREAQGRYLTDLWIDSLTVSRIALPRLKNHKLATLAEAFGAPRVSHQADDDVEALAFVWRVLLTALSEMPLGYLERMAHLDPETPWSLRPIFSYLAGENPGVPFSLKAIREERLKRLSLDNKRDYFELESYDFLDDKDLKEEFSKTGILGSMYPSYEPRLEQVAMSLEINKAFRTSCHSAIEAGTGVGKSIAYLLPALYLAKKNKVTTGVATKTNTLMDQLVSKELPSLQEAFDEPISYLALKGYEHYPCLRKLDHLANAQNKDSSEDVLNMIATLYAFSSQTSYGDIDQINLNWKHLPKHEVTTTSHECTKKYCPYYPQSCFVHGIRKAAEHADIVVTNHALLLRDVSSEGMILPPIRHWVIDEAHSFEQEARKQWAKSFSYMEVLGLLDAIGTVRSQALGQLSKLAQAHAGGTLLMAAISKAASQTSSVSTVLASFFSEVKALAHLSKQSDAYHAQTLWLSAELRSSQAWQEIVEIGYSLIDHMEKLFNLLNDAYKLALDIDEEGFYEISLVIPRLKEAMDSLMLVLLGENKDYTYSVQLDRRDQVLSESLDAEPLEVGQMIAKDFYPENSSVVFTSATIAVDENFDHFLDSVGLRELDRGDYHTLQLQSSYDYERNMSIIVAKDLSQPNTRNYLSDMEEFLYKTHVSMQGACLTLFTNRKEMEYLHKSLKTRLENEGLELICQLKNTSIKYVREAFLEDERTSLFALKSFWEGFDAVGDTLRCVIIPKLPFPSPNNPLSKERSLRDQRAWIHYDLPETILSVKQAAGRLIRSSSDTGCLILADSRVVHKSYGKLFLRSLPKKDYLLLGNDELDSYLRMWNTIN
ncbi:MAG: helicase C-terminal domain-containing protein [Coriobacteriia bacterium]|nr:helicase C-terminal domain-containing protein [Coriobacteriia bacterium]